jgi:hypothetical protein
VLWHCALRLRPDQAEDRGWSGRGKDDAAANAWPPCKDSCYPPHPRVWSCKARGPRATEPCCVRALWRGVRGPMRLRKGCRRGRGVGELALPHAPDCPTHREPAQHRPLSSIIDAGGLPAAVLSPQKQATGQEVATSGAASRRQDLSLLLQRRVAERAEELKSIALYLLQVKVRPAGRSPRHMGDCVSRLSVRDTWVMFWRDMGHVLLTPCKRSGSGSGQ